MDDMLMKEDIVVLMTLSQLMSEKIEEPISHVHGWVKGQIAIVVTRFYSRMIRGDRITSPLRDQ